ncbi:hypothetical protein ACR9E3_31825 [Actinomycetospora sp. C-140]
MTKDRIGAGVAVVAAIIGLVLVFTYRDVTGGGDDDDGPAAPPSVSQMAPAPGVPGQGQQPAPGQVQQQPAQPAQPAQPDNDGDDDG